MLKYLSSHGEEALAMVIDDDRLVARN
jgi:hypothetical protein